MGWDDPWVLGGLTTLAVLVVAGVAAVRRWRGKEGKEEWQYFKDGDYELRTKTSAHLYSNLWRAQVDFERRWVIGQDEEGNSVWSLWETLSRADMEYKKEAEK